MFDLILYIPVNNFSIMSRWSTKQGHMCLVQVHNTVTLMRLVLANGSGELKHHHTSPPTELDLESFKVLLVFHHFHKPLKQKKPENHKS